MPSFERIDSETVYEGRIFLFEAHLRRLRSGLGELRMPADSVDSIATIAERLLDHFSVPPDDLRLAANSGAAMSAEARLESQLESQSGAEE